MFLKVTTNINRRLDGGWPLLRASVVDPPRKAPSKPKPIF